MCGIYGAVGPGATREAVEAMGEALAHRGPDGEGLFFETSATLGTVALGSRRLAILDPERGAQPMRDGPFHLVHNGELYDHDERRRDLEARGHRFRTRCDTEVALRLFIEHGADFVHRLAGMFAVAAWDARSRALVLARDRIGQKPLVYALDRRGETLFFASEEKALVAAARAGAEIDIGPDLEALHHFLALRFVPSPATLYRGVRELPPAHRLVWRDGDLRVEPYWTLRFDDEEPSDPRSGTPSDTPNDTEILERLDEALDAAVRRHLVADVEVGAHLSGGLDSSTIVARMARLAGPPRTFAVGVPGSDVDELPWARRVAEALGTRHVEDSLGAGPGTGDAIEVFESLSRLAHHLDLPPDPIAPCVDRAAALAARHGKAVLGGDGGDELFAGFDRYAGVLALDGPWRGAAALGGRLGARLWAGMPSTGALRYKSPAQKLRWLSQVASESDLARRYAAATTTTRFDAEAQARLYGEALRGYLGVDPADTIIDAVRGSGAREPLHRLLHADLVTRLPGHSLRMGDRLSMAHGLELRSPFLDDRLVDLVVRLPARVKLRRRFAHTELKWALRRLAERDLPSEVARRPKHGFMLPIADWLRGPIHEATRRRLLEGRGVADGLFRAEEITRLLDEHRAARVDHHARLWLLLGVEAWLENQVG